MTYNPHNFKRYSEFVQFEDANGLEYQVFGDDSRLQIAYEIAESIQPLLKHAETLLKDFMKHPGTFSASYVEVFAKPEDDGSEFLIHHTFESDAEPHEFGYTYFDVVFSVREPPNQQFWPFKFIVGFL